MAFTAQSTIYWVNLAKYISPLVLVKFKFGDLNAYHHRHACIKFNW